jgi:hypothetical protein
MCLRYDCIRIILLVYLQQWVFRLGLRLLQQCCLDDERFLLGTVHRYECTIDRKRSGPFVFEHQLRRNLHLLMPVWVFWKPKRLLLEWGLDCFRILLRFSLQQPASYDHKRCSIWLRFRHDSIWLVLCLHLQQWIRWHGLGELQQWCVVDE